MIGIGKKTIEKEKTNGNYWNNTIKHKIYWSLSSLQALQNWWNQNITLYIFIYNTNTMYIKHLLSHSNYIWKKKKYNKQGYV